MKKYRIIHIPSGEFSEFTGVQLKKISSNGYNPENITNKNFADILTVACWYKICSRNCKDSECPWSHSAQLECNKLEYIIEELND